MLAQSYQDHPFPFALQEHDLRNGRTRTGPEHGTPLPPSSHQTQHEGTSGALCMLLLPGPSCFSASLHLSRKTPRLGPPGWDHPPSRLTLATSCDPATRGLELPNDPLRPVPRTAVPRPRNRRGTRRTSVSKVSHRRGKSWRRLRRLRR